MRIPGYEHSSPLRFEGSDIEMIASETGFVGRGSMWH